MSEHKRTRPTDQLDEETQEIVFTTGMQARVIDRLQRPERWWQREVRIHVPTALAAVVLCLGLAWWRLDLPMPDHPAAAREPALIALQSGIFVESELDRMVVGRSIP